MVTVATEREGRARAAKCRTHSGKVIATFVLNVEPRGSPDNVNRIGIVLITDEPPASGRSVGWFDRYRWIGRKYPAHLRVNHSKGEYVRHARGAGHLRHAPATAHANTAEPFNATLKRACAVAVRAAGVFHWFSIKHMDRYLHETSFRWNARRQDTDTRLAALFTRLTGRLRWKKLTA